MNDLLDNQVLLVAGLAWAVAQALKLVVHLWRERTIVLSLLFTQGGMPSGHSALVTALTVGLGKTQGLGSPLFALAAILAAIVMYDAAGVRRSVGIHAGIINRMLDERDGGTATEQRLRELIGHSPVQVAAGALVGLLVSFACMG